MVESVRERAALVEEELGTLRGSRDGVVDITQSLEHGSDLAGRQPRILAERALVMLVVVLRHHRAGQPETEAESDAMDGEVDPACSWLSPVDGPRRLTGRSPV